MRVLVLGGDGMLGHELAGTLVVRHDVAVTVRGDAASAVPAVRALPEDRVFGGIDVRCHDDVAGLLDSFRPDAVVNAVGLVERRREGRAALPAVEVNTVFPHRLARLCRIADIRLVHLSTDHVFSGRRGHYTEDDQPDPVGVYGMSKLLGEVREAPALTLRTSVIGLEPTGRATGLVEWFLAQRGQVSGHRRAVGSWLTTMELARVVDQILSKHEDLTGLWHVAAAEPITKLDLLVGLADRLRRAAPTDDSANGPASRRAVPEVVATDGPVCDRGLVADRFAAATGYTTPGWEPMLDELAERIVG